MEILLTNLAKIVDQKTILELSALKIEKGKITGILGENGSGKTTLLTIMSGLDQQYQGEITYDGLPYHPDLSRKMTMVKQQPYLFKQSVYENLEYPLKVRQVDKPIRKEIVQKLLFDFQIETIKDQRADTLSGGEAQKVVLARALAATPELLLLDEPTANIHSDSIKTVEQVLKKYHEETGCTIVFVTHHMDQAKRFCDKLIYL